MALKSKRDFIKSILISTTALKLMPTSALTITDAKTDSDLYYELSVINEAWIKHFRLNPKTYLECLSGDLWRSNSLLQDLIIREFNSNKTIEVKGLILSQTEAALLAVTADKQVRFNNI